MNIKVRDEFISAGKINSLTKQDQITKEKVELRFDAFNNDDLTSGIAILQTKRRIKSDSVRIETDVRGMYLKSKDF